MIDLDFFFELGSLQQFINFKGADQNIFNYN